MIRVKIKEDFINKIVNFLDSLELEENHDYFIDEFVSIEDEVLNARLTVDIEIKSSLLEVIDE